MSNKKRIFGTAVMLCIIFGFTGLCISCSSKKKSAAPPVQYSMDEEPLLPAEPGFQDSYIYANALVPYWTQEEGAKWFTPPEGKLLEQLKDSNDLLIRRILESVP